MQTPPSHTIAIQMLSRSHHCIEGLERVHSTGSSQHFMGLCNCGYVTSSAFKMHRQSYRRVESLEWVQFSKPFQHSMGICNRASRTPIARCKEFNSLSVANFSVGMCHHRANVSTFVLVVCTHCQLKDGRMQQPRVRSSNIGLARCGSQRCFSLAFWF